MNTLNPVIHQQETGNKLRKLIKANGYSVKDVQEACGFENPQAVYKWLRGDCLPSVDNLIILSILLHTGIDDILVYDDGDVVMFGDIQFFVLFSFTFRIRKV